MVENIVMGSILSVDWGSVATKAFLLDKANGEYRLLAQGRAPTQGTMPEDNPLRALREAISALEEATGHRILGEQGYPLLPEREMEGVDVFTISLSLAPPLRVMLVGLSEDLSLTLARKALNAYYATEAGSFSFLEEQDRAKRLERLLKNFLSGKPDVVLMVGGTEGGAVEPLIELAQMLAIAYSLWTEAERPPVIFAGNSAARSQVVELLGDRTQVRVTDNILPSLEEENWGGVFGELEDLYQRLKVSTIYGLGSLRSLVSVPIVPSASSFTATVRYLAHMYRLEKGAIGIDLGGSNTTVVGATREHFSITVREDLGLSKALSLLQEDRLKEISQWLPLEEIAEERISELILERQFRPDTIPMTEEELRIEEALARVIIQEALSRAREQWRAFMPEVYPNLMPEVDLIVVTGSILAGLPHEGEIALMVLDAFQPVGVTNLAVDKLGLSVALGALAPINAVAAIQVLEKDTFTVLGPVIAPVGNAPDEEVALRIHINFDDGRTLDVEVAAGSIELIPLAPGHKATLEIKPSRYFDLGLGARGKEGKVEVQGGSLGIVIDARGRPLKLPSSPAERIEKMRKWLWEIG